MPEAGQLRLRRLPTDELAAADLTAIRRLMEEAFGTDPDEAFGDDDWQHSLGGMHFVLDIGGEIVSHASVVERELQVEAVRLRTGYVEAVATAPEQQGRGYGTIVMREVNAYIGERFELGALGTGSTGFYDRLGWRVWQGPTFVRTPAGLQRTPDEDGGILVLFTPRTPPLDLSAAISCDWRPGDVW